MWECLLWWYARRKIRICAIESRLFSAVQYWSVSKTSHKVLIVNNYLLDLTDSSFHHSHGAVGFSGKLSRKAHNSGEELRQNDDRETF